MRKTILVTGLTDGIGLAAARMPVSQGHYVLLHGRNTVSLVRLLNPRIQDDVWKLSGQVVDAPLAGFVMPELISVTVYDMTMFVNFWWSESCMGRFLFLLILLITVPRTGLAREVVGWVEKARIYPGGMLVKARVDTGARTSSLGAESVEYIDRDNETWVRFSTTNYKGETVILERKVHRTAKVKQNVWGLQERPVIKLGICLADIYREVEVNLQNRNHLNYQMLIGRESLNRHFLVDPDNVFINPPRCENVVPMDNQK